MVIVVFKWFYINSFFTVYFVAWDDSILLYCFISAWYYQHSIIISNCLEYIPISPFWGVIYLFSVGQSSIISWWNPAVILRPNLPRWHLPARSWFTTPVVHYFFSDIYHKPTLSLRNQLSQLRHQPSITCSLWLNSPFNRGWPHREPQKVERFPDKTGQHRGWDIGQTSIRPAASQDPSWQCRTKVVPQKSDCECWFIIPWKLVRYITNKKHSYWSLPSGKRLHNYGKSPIFNG